MSTAALASKVALVTGGGSGIGRASALAFARAGARVIIADIVVAHGEETVSLIRHEGGEATLVPTDVSRAGGVAALVAQTVAVYGRLDCAHNNAGVEGPGAPTADYPEEQWDHVMAVNLKGVWVCMKYEIAQMLQHGGGCIVNTASVFGLRGEPWAAAYVASKHGVVGLTRTAALDYARTGIRVNAVCPGYVRTPMTERVIGANPELEAQAIEREPVRRFGMPEEVAATVLWLCTDAASFVTGHTLVVDGGMTA